MKKESGDKTVPVEKCKNSKEGGLSQEALKNLGRNEAKAALQRGSKK